MTTKRINNYHLSRIHDSDRRQRIHRTHPQLRKNIVADILEKCQLNKRIPGSGGLNGVGIGEGHIKVSVNENMSDTMKKLLAECMGNNYAGVPIQYHSEQPRIPAATNLPYHSPGRLISENPLSGNAGQTGEDEYTEFGYRNPSKHYPKDPNDPESILNVYDIVKPYSQTLAPITPLDSIAFPPVHPPVEYMTEQDRENYHRSGIINDPFAQNLLKYGARTNIYKGGTSTGCMHEQSPMFQAGEDCGTCTLTGVVKDAQGNKYLLSNGQCFGLVGDTHYIDGKPRTTVKTALRCQGPFGNKSIKTHLDASLIRVDPDLEGKVSWEIHGLGIPIGVQEPEIGMTVNLTGQDEYVYTGKIAVVNYSMVNFRALEGSYRGAPSRCLVTYEDLFEIYKNDFGRGGDSGGPVYNPHTRRVVGIFFSKSPEGDIAVAANAEYIEPELGVTFGPPDRFRP